MSNKQNAAEDYFEKTQKYMNHFWGFSDSDDNDNVNKINEKKKRSNGNYKQINNEKKKLKSKIISSKDQDRDQDRDQNQDKDKNKNKNKNKNKDKNKDNTDKSDFEREKYKNLRKASSEKNAFKQSEPSEFNELYVEEKKRKKKKKHKEKKTDISCYNEETNAEVEEEDIRQKPRKRKRENFNNISKNKHCKKTEDNAIPSETKLGKVETVEKVKDVFSTISEIQGTHVKKENNKIWNSTMKKRNKNESGREKEGKKQNKVKVTKKETNEIRNALYKERKEFKNLLQEVENIAKQHLDKFQKKIILNQEIKKLGGKFDKSRKMPYPELVCRKRAMKRYIQERKEMERYSGVKLQSGDYIDMQDVFRKKKKEKKKERWKNFKLF